LRQDTAEMHGMVGACGAVPSDRSGEFASARVEEEYGAAFGGDDIEEHGKELPLKRVDVAHGADRGADFEQSGERAGQADRRRKGCERFGLQVEEVISLELLSGEADSGVVIKLDRTALGSCCGLGKKEEGRLADGDLVTEGENAVGDGNAVDVGAGGRVQIAQREAAGRFGNGAMLGSDSRIFQPDGVGRIAADGKSSGDGKTGVFPGAADDGDSWSQVWDSRDWSEALRLRVGILSR
jgi:hypothetical protein